MIKKIFLQKKVSQGIFMMAGLFIFFGSVTSVHAFCGVDISIGAVTNITDSSATLNASFNGAFGSCNPVSLDGIFDYGIISDNYTATCNSGTGGIGTFSCTLTNLDPGIEYFFTPYVYVYDDAATYGGSHYTYFQSYNESSFTTLEASLSDIIIPNPDATQIQARVTEGYMSVTDGITGTASASTNVNVTMRTAAADVIFPVGTNIDRPDRGAFDFTAFTAQTVTESVQFEQPTSRTAISIGTGTASFSFSQDVTIIMNVGEAFNGQELDILYQNVGDPTWHTHSTPTCLVADGTCTFTTDHATIYTVNGVHSETGEAPININVEVQDTLSLDCYETGNGSGDHIVTLSDSVTGVGYTVAGISSIGRSTCDTTTNDDQGYYLTIERSTEDVTWAGTNGSGQHAASNVLIHEDPNINDTWYEIPDTANGLSYYNGSNAQTWTEGTTKGFGFSVITFPDTNPNNNILDEGWTPGANPCLDGSNPTTDTATYAAVPDSAQPIAAVTQYESGPTTTNICYKVDVLPSQQSGQYAGQVTYTATSDASGYHE